jgi:glycosyltransferase involved in cell wall biosynthesis
MALSARSDVRLEAARDREAAQAEMKLLQPDEPTSRRPIDREPYCGAKIVWIGRVVPFPQDSGDRVYTYGLVRSLVEAGAEVTYLGMETSENNLKHRCPADGTPIRWLTAHGRASSNLRSLFSSEPLSATRYRSNKLWRLLLETIETEVFDIIVFDQYSSSWVARKLMRWQGRYRPLYVHVAHNNEASVAHELTRSAHPLSPRGFFLKWNEIKIRRAESFLLSRSDVCYTLTGEDAAALRAKANDIAVIPPGYSGGASIQRRPTLCAERNVVVAGNFQWLPKQINLERFVRVASPLFSRNGVKLSVVGNVPEKLKSKLLSSGVVEFHGFVPDIQSVFQDARCALIFEETGGGFKLKSLDYIYHRLPIFALAGSCNGLPVEMSPFVSYSNTMEELARAVCERIDDFSNLQAMSDGAYRIGKQYFQWQRSADRFLSVACHSVPRTSAGFGQSSSEIGVRHGS